MGPQMIVPNVRNYLTETFGAQWTGRGGPVFWPPRSLDLTFSLRTLMLKWAGATFTVHFCL